MQATAKDLRFYSKELLDAVARGEEVVITYRGKPCAKLIPINNETTEEDSDDELFGIWKDNDSIQDVDGYLRKLREGRFNAD